MEPLTYFTLGLGLFDAIPKGYPFIVSTDYTPKHIRDTVAHFTSYAPSLLVLAITFRHPILDFSEVRFEYVDGHFVDNERQYSIEQRNVLDDASFDHVMVQLMPTQPVDPRSLGLKRNREEGGDRGRGGGGGDRGRGGGGYRGIGRGRKRRRGNVRGVPYRGDPLDVMDYSSVVADPCGNWFISGSSRGVVTLWDLRFCIPVNSWQYSLPCPIEKMCLFDPPSGTPLSVATRTLVYVAAVCNEVSLCNAENGSCHQMFYEHGGRHKFSKMLI
ncbi:hypothetical protein OROGR_028766 [Orobanche gracilis]